MRLQASQAAQGIGGTLRGPDVDFDGASFDTRTLEAGQMFVAMVAERDGHDFVDAAFRNGAVVALVSHDDVLHDDDRHDDTHDDPHDGADTASSGVAADGERSRIVVDDTAEALMRLGAWARDRSSATVVGVTGSVGKTSTKDLVATACGAQRATAANVRSFNNEQGLPTTILGSPDGTEVLVLEMGMRGFGQIARLCDVARPDVGVVTTVGHSHTELVGGIEGVATAKQELVEALPPSGVAVLNADDHRVAAMARATDAEVVTFGRSGDVRITDLELDELARPRFTIETPWGSERVELAVSGEHMAANAAAALAVAGSIGVDLAAAVAALGDAQVSSMRMEVTRLANGAIVVNDTYNANPTSMAAALDALVAMEARRRFAVLGPMAELDDPGAGHRDVARRAEGLGVQLVTTGTDLYGVRPTDDPVGAIGALGEGDVVLVKASRSAGLERIVADLGA